MYGAAGAEAARGVDELALAQGQRLAAHDPADVGQLKKPMMKISTAMRRPLPLRPNASSGMTPDERDGEQQQREGQEDVHRSG